VLENLTISNFATNGRRLGGVVVRRGVSPLTLIPEFAKDLFSYYTEKRHKTFRQRIIKLEAHNGKPDKTCKTDKAKAKAKGMPFRVPFNIIASDRKVHQKCKLDSY
jgi:hypothetical protein